MIPIKRKIDLTCYKRLGMYEVFKDRQLPCFSITCNVDITNLMNFVKSKGYRFFITMSHGICNAINRVPELRQRLIDGELYEFERVDPGYTVLLDDSTFSFCDSLYLENFSEYYAYASQRIEAVKTCPDCGKDEKHHMFFITNLPWISFTSITHPYDEKYGSIPVIAIGKYFRQGNQIIMPLGIQAHHGIVDGFHVGLFFEHLNRIVDNLEGFDE
jgi:chloramphenicol O-acetyltransferase type A